MATGRDLTAMTAIQWSYYNYIKQYIKENKVSPTIYEAAKHFGVRPTTASRMFQKLDLRGFLYRPVGTRRTVRCLRVTNRKIRVVGPGGMDVKE